MATMLRPPTALSFTPVSAESVEVMWDTVPGATAYEVRGGGAVTIRKVVSTSAQIRGLLPAHTTLIQVRSVSATTQSEWADIMVRPTTPIPTTPTDGAAIPLIDTDRQSMILRFPDSHGNNIDTRLSVWWSPSDMGWWASLEAPVNTQAVSSRRLGLNCGLLDNIFNVLAGNIVMRATGEFVNEEPTRRSIAEQTHALIWEPR